MRPLKDRVSITLDNDLIEKIKMLAEEDDRAFSQYINLVLKAHVEAIESKNSVKERE
ncbi:MAG: toxin-antitoxin system protein [Defluviitaleaceae bacterium]|nr:toxin-antitoxin system protein [Defluviitaleaceae bacterium]